MRSIKESCLDRLNCLASIRSAGSPSGLPASETAETSWTLPISTRLDAIWLVLVNS